MRSLVFFFTFLLFSAPSSSQVNLSSLGLILEPPEDEETPSVEPQPTIDLSLRPEATRRQRGDSTKLPYTNHGNAAASFAESAMLMLQQYVPSFGTSNTSNSIVDALSRAAGKLLLDNTEESDYVNPIGLPCNPNEVRLCFPRTTTTTTTSPPALFSFFRGGSGHNSKTTTGRRKDHQKQQPETPLALAREISFASGNEFFAPTVSPRAQHRMQSVSRSQEALLRSQSTLAPDIYDFASAMVHSEGSTSLNTAELAQEEANLLYTSHIDASTTRAKTDVTAPTFRYPSTSGSSFRTTESSGSQVLSPTDAVTDPVVPNTKLNLVGLSTLVGTPIPRRAVSTPTDLARRNSAMASTVYEGLSEVPSDIHGENREDDPTLYQSTQFELFQTPTFRPSLVYTAARPYVTAKRPPTILATPGPVVNPHFSSSSYSKEAVFRPVGLPDSRDITRTSYDHLMGTTGGIASTTSRIEQLLEHGIELVSPFTWLNRLFPPTPSHLAPPREIFTML